MSPQDMGVLIVVGGIGLVIAFAVVAGVVNNLLYLCGPNEVLIFSGSTRRVGPPTRLIGYKIVKGGRAIRKPLIEKVDKMDLTNMTIAVEVKEAFSKGGIPLTVQGVANVKIAGDEPLIFNAIERFLGKNRDELIKIIKDTLEGNLRGILARLTPEQVNEDKIAFAQQLVEEADDDLKRIGIILDTLKIQNVLDEVGYLDAIGRKRSADLQMRSIIAEANAKAQSAIQAAHNLEGTKVRQIDMEAEIARAEADRKIADAETKKGALVAERKAKVAAMVARAEAEIPVQQARREQVRLQLDADVIRPAVAQRSALEAQAKSDAAQITEAGKANVRALDEFVSAWLAQGSSARNVVMMEKLASISRALSATVAGTEVDRLALMSGDSSGSSSFSDMLVDIASRLKAATGADPVRRFMADGGEHEPHVPAPTSAAPSAQAAVTRPSPAAKR